MKRTNFYSLLAALLLCAVPALFAAARVGEPAPAFTATAERRRARSNEAIRRFAVCCWIVSPLLAMTRSPDPDQN